MREPGNWGKELYGSAKPHTASSLETLNNLALNPFALVWI